jgi:RNA ligase partner protein
MAEKKFVLDTSLFVNPHARKSFGKTPSAAVHGFVKIIRGTDLDIFMPPSIRAELKNFVNEDAIDELDLVIKKRAPNVYSIYLPAAVFYDFIEDIRIRINKGLRLAEEFAKDNRPENDEKLGRLREKYREAMRTGIIDSKEDFELVLLAKELDATLVSSDEGVMKFANQIGCGWLPAEKFHPLLKRMKKTK